MAQVRVTRRIVRTTSTSTDVDARPFGDLLGDLRITAPSGRPVAKGA